MLLTPRADLQNVVAGVHVGGLALAARRSIEKGAHEDLAVLRGARLGQRLGVEQTAQALDGLAVEEPVRVFVGSVVGTTCSAARSSSR